MTDKMETLLNKLEDAKKMRGILRVNQIDCPLTREEIETIISLLKGGWVKCEDRLPKPYQTVLFFLKADKENGLVQDVIVKDWAMSDRKNKTYLKDPRATHWTELPQPPTE